jgi:hypothetical protein
MKNQWVPSVGMGPYQPAASERFRVPWVKGRCRRRAYGCSAGLWRFGPIYNRVFVGVPCALSRGLLVARIATSD